MVGEIEGERERNKFKFKSMVDIVQSITSPTASKQKVRP